MTPFSIGKRKIGEKYPVFIISELSCNHKQNLSLAKETIHAMKESGVDAVKIQTYTPETMTIDSDKKYFKIQKGTIWDGKKFFDLYKEAYTPWEWQAELQALAKKLGLVFFSSAFDNSAVDFLEKLHVPAHKIASFEITDIPLIQHMAATKKPMFISTGVAELADIEDAVRTARKFGCQKLALLKCTSAYPTPMSEVNLRVIPDLKKRFGVEVGLSDHTMGTKVPIAAVALGASIVEKHFILDRKKIGGPDSEFSLEPKEFKEMVEAIRDTEAALGKVTYKLTEKAKSGRSFARSLFVVEDIKKGEKFTDQNVKSIRPFDGMRPKYLAKVLHKRASRNLTKGTPLKPAHILKWR